MSETYTITNCPIFAVGQWNGDIYTEADLDHMVAAFNQVGFQPPMKLGHDESQQLAKNDGMPAIGWATNLRRVGTQLYCDLKDLPKRVYDAIKRKNYNRVSAEVYWDYTCNGKKWPRVLKALSLLGADIPAVTSLGALETLYDGEGQEFKRYDMGMLPMPFETSYPQLSPLPAPVKAKSSVNYRESEEGGLERCGACSYFQGPADPEGKETFIGGCSIIVGEVASNWVCDLWEVREAFSSPAQKDYTIEQRGKKWVLLAKGSGEVLGEHETEEDAKAQERAIQASKAKAKGNSQNDYSGDFDEGDHPREDDGKFAPKGGSNDDDDNDEENPAGVSDDKLERESGKWGDAGGSEVRSRDKRFRVGDVVKKEKGKPSRIAAIKDSFIIVLDKKGKTESVHESDLKKYVQADRKRGPGTKIIINRSDAKVKERRYMEIEEIEGEFCVMKGGEKQKCFATKEEADAYQVSMMAQSAAEVKALQQKLDASEKLNKDLTSKVTNLEQTAISLSAKFSELEERTKTAEVEAGQLKEQNRKTANEVWLSQQSTEGNLKVLPWEQPYVAFILDHMTGGSVKTYADNGSDISPAEAFKKLYEQRKPGTILTEELSKGNATKTANQPEKHEYNSLHEARAIATKRAKQYMSEHPEVKEFSSAFKTVLEQDADLKSAVSGVTAAGAQKAKEGTERMQRMFNA